MRILLAVPQDEELGGVASVVRNLAQHLRSRGHQVFFFHPAATIFFKPKETKLGFPGFDLRLQMLFGERHPVISIPAFLTLFPLALCQLIRLIRRYRIQIINIHYPTDCFFYFAICTRLLPVALVTSIHGADVFTDGRPRLQYSRAFRLLLSSSDRIIAPSRRFQKDFLTVFPELNEKTTFIHNGVNLAELSDFRTEAICNNQFPYILCISAYKQQKAIDVLIQAFKRVQEIDSSLKLVIVGAGAGPLRGQVEDLAVSLGLQERIEFLGPKGRVEVAKLLHGCKLFVLPSRFETFGIVILEAMACKKAVVSTTVGGIPEIIENGRNGILVEPDNPDALAEALIAVLKNRTLRLTIANNGWATVRERFRQENMGAAYETAFGDLLVSPPDLNLFT
jgi:glycosyltransferase involved in cell wall biosynthesis